MVLCLKLIQRSFWTPTSSYEASFSSRRKWDSCSNPQHFKSMHHKIPHKELFKFTYGPDFSFLSKTSLSNETKASRDFKFCGNDTMQFLYFCRDVFWQTKNKICNLVFCFVWRQLEKIKTLKTDTLSICFRLRGRWWMMCVGQVMRQQNKQFFVTSTQNESNSTTLRLFANLLLATLNFIAGFNVVSWRS